MNIKNTRPHISRVNHILSKPDNAIHIGNMPGRTFRALNRISLKCDRIFLNSSPQKVMALIITCPSVENSPTCHTECIHSVADSRPLIS